ncbi:MAG: bZIP transcription factor, partial [archaeon]|nr:bZIP transcription factor [archaeon]
MTSVQYEDSDSNLFGFLTIGAPMTDDFQDLASPRHGQDAGLHQPALDDLAHWSEIHSDELDMDLPFFPLDTLQALPLSPESLALSSPGSFSSSSSPSSSPTSFPPTMVIKTEALSSPPPSPSRKRSRTGVSHGARSPSAGKYKSVYGVFESSGYSSDEAEFDPNAMPHPSIMTKTPSQLSKEELLSLTSRGLAEYERRLKTFHTLTHAEQNLLKRQRRLVKNRESAQQSRMRKKVYVQELERRVSHLVNERDDLFRQNQELLQKNQLLQKQLNSTHPQQAGSSPQMQLGSCELLPTTKAPSKREQHHLNGHRGAQAAGVCALVVVFSFALFLGIHGGPNGGSQPAFVPHGSSSHNSQFNTGRLLHEYNASSSAYSEADDDLQFNSSPPLDTPKSPMIDITSLDSDDEPAGLMASPPPTRSPFAVVRPSAPLETLENSGLVVKREPEVIRSPVVAAPSYIYCAEAQHLVPINDKK